MKRNLSWFIAALGVIAPPIWAHFMMEADRQAQVEVQGFVCGLPLMAIIAVACLMTASLSLVATGLGALAYQAIPRPRPIQRSIELFILAVPLIVAASVFAKVVFGVPS